MDAGGHRVWHRQRLPGWRVGGVPTCGLDLEAGALAFALALESLGVGLDRPVEERAARRRVALLCSLGTEGTAEREVHGGELRILGADLLIRGNGLLEPAVI